MVTNQWNSSATLNSLKRWGLIIAIASCRRWQWHQHTGSGSKYLGQIWREAQPFIFAFEAGLVGFAPVEFEVTRGKKVQCCTSNKKCIREGGGVNLPPLLCDEPTRDAHCSGMGSSQIRNWSGTATSQTRTCVNRNWKRFAQLNIVAFIPSEITDQLPTPVWPAIGTHEGASCKSKVSSVAGWFHTRQGIQVFLSCQSLRSHR